MTWRPISRIIFRSASSVAAGGTRKTLFCEYVGITSSGLRFRPVGSLPFFSARIPSLIQFAHHGDSLVRGAEMLQGVNGDRPLTDLCLKVSRQSLAFLIRAQVVHGEIRRIVDVRGLGRFPLL